MRRDGRHGWWIGGIALAIASGASAALLNARQEQGDKAPPGAEWAYWGGDAGSNRYSALDQINAGNAGELEVIWRWKAANFGPEPDSILRATPIYVNGKLYTVAGIRRTVACIELTTGETLWIWREKTDNDPRWEASTRKNYGKGVAFGRVDGRPYIYYLGAGFTLWALDADTGLPVQTFGKGGRVDLAYGLDNPDNPKAHPALEGVDLGNTGQNSHANLLVTKTLLFYGEGRGGDRYFHALDKQTGKEIAKVELPAQTNTAPMTFFHAGNQYIVMAVASGSFEPELVALALPSARPRRVSLGGGN